MGLGKYLRDDERLVGHPGLILPLSSRFPKDEPLEVLRRLLVLKEDRRVALAGGPIGHPIAADEARDLLDHRDDLLLQPPLLLLPVPRLHVPHTYRRVHILASFLPGSPPEQLASIVESAARRVLLRRIPSTETVWKLLRAGQTSDHQARHRRVDEGLPCGAQPLVVLAHPPVVAYPGEGSLHHPPPRQHPETL